MDNSLPRDIQKRQHSSELADLTAVKLHQDSLGRLTITCALPPGAELSTKTLSRLFLMSCTTPYNITSEEPLTVPMEADPGQLESLTFQINERRPVLDVVNIRLPKETEGYFIVSGIPYSSQEGTQYLLSIGEKPELTQEIGRQVEARLREVRHDVTNTLTALQTQAAIVSKIATKQIETDPPPEELTGRLQRAVTGIEHSVNVILTVLAADKHRTKQFIEEVPIETIVADIENYINPDRTNLPYQWETEIDPQIGTIRTIRSQLFTVLLNLVENASKHNKERSKLAIKLTMFREPDPQNPEVFSSIIIQVTDNGIGIQADDLPHIFKNGMRGRQTTANNTPGEGLGLYRVKQSVTLLGGEISVYSVVDRGTVFTIRLPLEQ